MTSPLFSKNSKAKVIVALISIALAAGWLRAQAQTTSGAVVSGTVTIDHGRVAAFRVKAKDTMRRIAYTVYTQKGRYNIYNLPAGHYEISVLEEGIESVTQAVDLPAGKTPHCKSEFAGQGRGRGAHRNFWRPLSGELWGRSRYSEGYRANCRFRYLVSAGPRS